MRVEQIEANHCLFFSIAPGILSRVKKEQEKAFGGFISCIFKDPPKNNRTVTWNTPLSHVYTFDIHRKSPRPEGDMWKLNVSLF